ncbi:4-hydroxy-tetrahydrodipicolinate synthase [Thalassotalea ganghwensis]
MNQSTSSINEYQVWTALVTPLHPDGTVDFDSLRENALLQNKVGNGILLLGSTGEGLALSQAEHKAIVDFVCQLALTSPIMVAVGGYQLSEQIAWINYCNSLSINGYLLGTPIYAKPGPAGQTQWFKALLDQAKFPCMLYNVPSRSGVGLSVTTLEQLKDHPNCWALKEASGDLTTFLAFKQRCPNVRLYSGEDAMMPYLAGAGVCGLVSVSSNVWPEAAKRYVELAIAGQPQGLFPLWQNAVDALFQVASPIPVKVLMASKGMIAHSTLRPPLTEQELAANDGLAEQDNLISQWLQRQSQALSGAN